ncbi:DUF2529 family protein [Bacillus sp. FJAT-49736]|uniref:DUF2529 family protein n=1 Tax=Bacillus sp. FJAT-49736 TaxID=2833582 RepID=UPI0032D5724F
MFLTQLNGLQQRIFEKEEEALEDAARLLAQAAVGEGKIYIKGFQEMNAICSDAIYGAEPLKYAVPLNNIDLLTETDRVLIATRFSTDKEALLLANQLKDKGIPFASLAGKVGEEEEDLANLADVHIDTRLIKPMLPSETGERVGFPSALIGLYIYHCLKFQLDEIISEYFEEI